MVRTAMMEPKKRGEERNYYKKQIEVEEYIEED